MCAKGEGRRNSSHLNQIQSRFLVLISETNIYFFPPYRSALDIPPKDKAELNEFLSILDPDNEGYADYPSFVAICALKFHARDQGSETHIREVDDAFGLFTGTNEDGEPQSSVITLAHLRRVAAVLKEEVDDELLRDMILEANGGAGVGKGVRKGDFEKVMKRAGVWR